MRANRLAFAVGLAALLGAAGAAAATTHLLAAGARKEADLRGYDQVQVATFTDATQPKFDKPEDETEFRAKVAEATLKFPDMLAEQLSQTQAFQAVRKPVEGKGLIVGGQITIYKESNVAARYIGLGIGSAEFDVKIEVKDAETGKLLATQTIEYSSSAIPGAVNALQTVGVLMDSAAQTFRDEMLIAKRVKHREETGRSGRARDKYKSGS
jgi:hypothetical protein